MKIAKKIKLNKLLDRLSGFDDKISGTFDDLDKELALVSEKLKQSVTVKALSEVNSKFQGLEAMFRPLLGAFANLKSAVAEKNTETTKLFTQKSKELESLSELYRAEDTQNFNNLVTEFQALQKSTPDYTKQIKDVESRLTKTLQDAKELDSQDDLKVQQQLIDLTDALKKFRIEALSKGGGSMNRQILVGGANPLTRYTDLNIKAGSNVTLTYQNNDTTKRVDLTIAASGGQQGSVTGITRSISKIATSQTAGNNNGTDYDYLCSTGLQLTLPTAVSNLNMYTVKNLSVSSVLLTPNGAETIDGQSNLILATQYTAVDLISDGSVWGIT